MATPDLIGDIRRAMDMVRDLPPSPRCIRAHHAVPYGRAFKQWMTNGDLIVWANRGEIEDLPRRAPARASMALPYGIPIVVEHGSSEHPSP